MSSSPRPLRLGSFAISSHRVIAVDEVAPIVLEVDIETGELLAVHTWTVPPFSGRPVATDVDVVDGSIVIASPATGGVVYIDRETEEVTTVALDAPIGRLVVDGSTVWAIAHPDWLEEIEDERFGRRPLVWQEPTDEQIAEHRAQLAGWRVAAPDPDREEQWVPIADLPDLNIDWRAMPDDGSDIIGPPTPAWRIEAGEAERVDFGGQLGALVPFGDRLVAVCILPTDPFVKRIEPGGSLSHMRPASVLLGTPESRFERVGTVPEFGGSVSVTGERIWLLGFDDYDRARQTVRVVDPADRTISRPSPLDVERPLAVMGGNIAELAREPARASQLLRLAPLDGGAATTIPIPDVSVEPETIVDSVIWFHKREEPAIVGIDTGAGTVREVRVDIDRDPYLPTEARDVVSSGSSITLPVMLADWELECCQPDAVVGEQWSASLLLGTAEPWWLEYATDPVPEDVRNLGVVEFEGAVLRPARQPQLAGLVAIGPIRVAVIGVTDEQHHFRGVLNHDAHGKAEGVLYSEIECRGVVRRVQGVAFRREHRIDDGERVSVPVAQEPLVDLQSTAEGAFETYVLTMEFAPDATV